MSKGAIELNEQAPHEPPQINMELCDGCGDCMLVCPQHGITVVNDKAQLLDADECIACGDCEVVCPTGAIGVAFEVVFAEAVDEAPEGDADRSSRPDETAGDSMVE